MKIVEIEASFSWPHKVAEYRIAHVTFSAKAQVLDGEDIETAQSQLFGLCKKAVGSEIKKMKS